MERKQVSSTKYTVILNSWYQRSQRDFMSWSKTEIETKEIALEVLVFEKMEVEN